MVNIVETFQLQWDDEFANPPRVISTNAMDTVATGASQYLYIVVAGIAHSRCKLTSVVHWSYQGADNVFMISAFPMKDWDRVVDLSTPAVDLTYPSVKMRFSRPQTYNTFETYDLDALNIQGEEMCYIFHNNGVSTGSGKLIRVYLSAIEVKPPAYLPANLVGKEDDLPVTSFLRR
jgi:hypothetical protein